MSRARHIHLGDRLQAIARIGRGELSVAQAAAELGVDVEQVRRWQALHAGERMLHFGELRPQPTPQVARLVRRAQRLAELVAAAENELRGLHQELVRRAVASNDSFDEAREPSRKVG